MRKLMTAFFLVFYALAFAADNGIPGQAGVPVTGLKPIGSLTGWHRVHDRLRLDCSDGSQVEVRFLAPDVARVRAAFHQPLPDDRHSWAVEKNDWEPVSWAVSQDEQSVTAKTAALVVRVEKSPLLVTFLDARTGKVLLRDRHPMALGADGQAILVRKELGFDEHFYGLGEKAARLDKRRGFFTMWNSDTPGYKEGTDPIYQSIPFYTGWREGRVYGVFFDNSYKSFFDFGNQSQEWASFGAVGGDLDYYFFAGPGFAEVLNRYTQLTGRMPMPPRWALGNQQSRWSYYPSDVAEEVVKQYRAADLPLDVLHLDIDYMDGYRVFTWDKERFADPKKMVASAAAQGVKVVTIIDPGVKYDSSGYHVVDEGLQHNYFLRRANGNLYVGKVWPGDSLFVDYTLAKAREWWGNLHSALTDQGVAGIWNDMNEPADFVDQTGVTQADVVSDDLGQKTLYAKNRNVFGMLMSRATYEGLERLRPGKRPYVITRAGYAGVQRYATMWTGDNTSTWKSLALSIPMFQTLGLSGEAFVGGDVGGFIGRADYELLVRWYQVAFLAPFCRNHKVKDGYDHEPFRYPDYYQGIVRKYLKLRYRLLPYLYTALEEAHRTGMPVFRPLVLNYPSDRNVLNLDDQFLIGRDLLVAPILRRGQSKRHVYFPKGEWVNYWTNQRIVGPTTREVEAPLETVPLFVRAGAILPLGPEQNFVDEKPSASIELVAYLDSDRRAEGEVYFDDGESTDYRKGKSLRSRLKVEGGKLAVDNQGDYRNPASFLLRVVD